MMSAQTRLIFKVEHTVLVADEAKAIGIAVAPLGLVNRLWGQDLPSPLQLEQAIDEIESAIMREHLSHGERGILETSDPLLRQVTGLQDEGASVSRDDVELLFQGLASASLSGRRPRPGEPWAGELAAALVILRECMHHLGFEAVQSIGCLVA